MLTCNGLVRVCNKDGEDLLFVLINNSFLFIKDVVIRLRLENEQLMNNNKLQ